MGYHENPDEALVMMPGMETAVLHHDEVSVELIACPVHVPEPFFRFLAKVKPRHRTVIVSDSLVGTGSPEGTVLTYTDGHRVYVESGVLRMIDDDPKVNGNLTGSAVTLDVGLARLMRLHRPSAGGSGALVQPEPRDHARHRARDRLAAGREARGHRADGRSPLGAADHPRGPGRCTRRSRVA